MDFVYDNNSRPYACIYNGTVYYYVLNLQGDVIRMVDTTGATVATYVYDAWGKNLTVTGKMASVNPIRYRGYYYDAQTKLYYLGSRYYDPVVKRFINADSASLITSNPNALTDKNLFSYCDNNPVNRADDGGAFWNLVAGAVVGGILGGISAAITGGSASDIAINSLSGAANGLVAATGLGPIGQAAISALIGAAGSTASSIASNKGDWSAKKVVKVAGKAAASALVSGVASIAGSALGKVTTGRLQSRGEFAIFKGSRKIGCFTKAQARNLVKKRHRIVNTARGLSSILGSVATWRSTTAASYAISKW